MATTTAAAATAATATAIKRLGMVGKLHPDTTAMLLCDVQERFRPLLYHGETVIRTCAYLTSVAHVLDMPLVVTQQYSKVFGPTIADCFAPDHPYRTTTTTTTTTADGGDGSGGSVAAVPFFEKKRFSMLTPEVSDHLQSLNRSSYILFGIETHVCVQQTALDLLEQGKEVHIIVDGVSSQQAYDRHVALQRLQQVGAYLTTAQSAAFMLCESADHPKFKNVSKLTVAHMKLANEFNDKLLRAGGDASSAL